ncbi:hypothetical protein [Streptomyces sp. NPDC101166]|uniref:hypothetical protein n=1 Tax=Streptomyces sp. NPDC101166 TaxID=3366120 RepID=UPI00380082F4
MRCSRPVARRLRTYRELRVPVVRDGKGRYGRLDVVIWMPGMISNIVVEIDYGPRTRPAGHDVRIAAQPSMHPVIVRSGMPAVAVGLDVDFAAVRRRTLSHERRETDRPGTAEELREAAKRDDGGLFSAWNEATTAALDDIVAFARAFRPDLVIGDTMAPAALVAAHVLGAVGVRHLWGPDILGSPGGEKILDVLPGYWEQFERHGVRPSSGDPAHRTVSPCPPSLRLPAAPGLLPLRWVPQ